MIIVTFFTFICEIKHKDYFLVKTGELLKHNLKSSNIKLNQISCSKHKKIILL